MKTTIARPNRRAARTEEWFSLCTNDFARFPEPWGELAQLLREAHERLEEAGAAGVEAVAVTTGGSGRACGRPTSLLQPANNTRRAADDRMTAM